MNRTWRNTLIMVVLFAITSRPAQANSDSEHEILQQRVKALEEAVHQHKHLWQRMRHEDERIKFLEGLSISGQMTMIYQSSGLDLKRGDLVNADGTPRPDFSNFSHKSATGTFSADLLLEKEFENKNYLLLNLEFASGAGVDAPLQGGAMVNNEVMEDPANHNQVYIARAYYEHPLPLSNEYQLIFDLGKFGVPDFFDRGKRVADQTTQFLNQAICNNGAFDYVQDLQGHGYTYGLRAALKMPWATLSGAAMSSDSHLDNITDKYSLIGSLALNYRFWQGADEYEKVELECKFYLFKNYGEYGRFDENGNFISKDATAINTANNQDNLDKAGFGISIDQSLPLGFNLFAKYGRQDDERDVRHNKDIDESIMFGFDVCGRNWKRPKDVLGVAYEIGRLTGNHRRAHEKGYTGFFDRPGIGSGNYADERVLEIYYRLALTKNIALSIDYQHIDNFYYSKKIGGVDFWAGRFNVAF